MATLERAFATFTEHFGDPPAQDFAAYERDWREALANYPPEALEFALQQTKKYHVYKSWPTLGEFVQRCQQFQPAVEKIKKDMWHPPRYFDEDGNFRGTNQELQTEVAYQGGIYEWNSRRARETGQPSLEQQMEDWNRARRRKAEAFWEKSRKESKKRWARGDFHESRRPPTVMPQDREQTKARVMAMVDKALRDMKATPPKWAGRPAETEAQKANKDQRLLSRLNLTPEQFDAKMKQAKDR